MRLWRSSRAKETRENWDLNVTATVEGRDRRCFPFQLCFISCVCEGRKTHKKYHISPEKTRNLVSFSEHPCSRCIKQRRRRRRRFRLGTPRCDDCSRSPRHKKQQLPQFGWRVEASEALGLANGADRGSLERNYYFFKRTWQKNPEQGVKIWIFHDAHASHPNFSRGSKNQRHGIWETQDVSRFLLFRSGNIAQRRPPPFHLVSCTSYGGGEMAKKLLNHKSDKNLPWCTAREEGKQEF